MAFWIITINLSTLLFDIKDRRRKKEEVVDLVLDFGN